MLKSNIHRKSKRGKPLTNQAKGSNHTKSRIRVRTLGTVRAKAKIGMKNLAYNMRRLVQLRRLNPFPA